MTALLIGWRPKVTAAAIGVTLGTLLFFVLLVMYQTLRQTESPVSFENGTAYAYTHRGDTVIVYEREVAVKANAEYFIGRTIVCRLEGSLMTYDFPEAHRRSESDQSHTSKRLVQMPSELPIGTQCALIVNVRWTPLFSMRSHHYRARPLEFTVGVKA